MAEDESSQGGMTEMEWFACGDLVPVLEGLPDKKNERRLRLLACACARTVWHFLTDDRCRRAVEVAERYADGRATAEEAVAAGAASQDASKSLPVGTAPAIAAGSATSTLRTFVNLPVPAVSPAYMSARMSARRAGNALSTDRGEVDRWGGWAPAEREMVSLVRDVFGNPFRPVIAEPAWLTPAAVNLAEAIYADRAFDRMPVLAEALEEAGCHHAGILAHCRGDGPHVRGCWVVDLVLSKQ